MLPKGEATQMLHICHYPLHQGKCFAEYYNCAIYYYIMLGLIEDFCKNFDEMIPQDLFLLDLDTCWQIICEVNLE